jgi:hypothetical protein
MIASAFGYIIKRQHDKIKSIQSQLSDKKHTLYNEVLSLFFDVLKSQKNNITANPRDIGIKIIELKMDLILYAPDPVLNKFMEWTRYTNNNPSNDPRHFLIFIELMGLIRKDMGHPKSSFNDDDFWKLVMTTDDEIVKMKALISTYNIENK